MQIIIEDIKQGMPGISPIEGANLLENCIVMLHRSKHTVPTILATEGMITEEIELLWNDSFSDLLDRTYADHASNTERSAICISVLLAKMLTKYSVIMRSRKGTGFDYFLGDEKDDTFQPLARLEISGIEKESDTNTVQSRFKQKCEQVTPTDCSNLPAYISIIEFGNPKAMFNKKGIS